MRKKVRQCAFLMSASMLFSGLWGAWGMAAYAAEIPPAAEQSETAVASQSVWQEPDGTAGKASEAAENAKSVSANVPPKKKVVKPDTVSVQAADGALLTIEGPLHVYGKSITFNSSSDWDDAGQGGGFDIALVTDAPLKKGAYITQLSGFLGRQSHFISLSETLFLSFHKSPFSA